MILTAAQLLALAQAAGTGGDPQTAVAVALAESGGDTAAVGRNSDRWSSRDRGLWQINDHWHPEVTDTCAFDARCNAQAAYVISSGWTDFSEWSTYRSGAYRSHMPDVATLEQQPPPARSLYGQSVRGETLTSPWFPGSWEITQGWGPTDYGGEPEGHGYQHWHAGVDVGVNCGTTITLPLGIGGVARALDNPDGYGTALVVLVDGGPAILLGHLRQRLVDDGTVLSGGEQLAISNNTGNSTGCHVHFEVRPQDAKRPLGMAAYGTDVDPSQWLTAGQAGSTAELFATSTPSVGDAIGKAMQGILSGAEILLGVGLVLVGLVAGAYGLRGESAATFRRDTRARVRQLGKPRAQPRSPRAPMSESEAAESRVRPDLQRRPGASRVGARP